MQVIPSTNRYSFHLPFFFSIHISFFSPLSLYTMAWATVTDTLMINYILNEKCIAFKKGNGKLNESKSVSELLQLPCIEWSNMFEIFIIIGNGGRYVMLPNGSIQILKDRVHWPTIESTKIWREWRLSLIVERRTHPQ